jgi:hypothetical protein
MVTGLVFMGDGPACMECRRVLDSAGHVGTGIVVQHYDNPH